jgi:Xaa-Pro aminopeptidase
MTRPSPKDSRWFIEHRRRLTALLAPGSLAVVNANDIPPTNADGTLALVPNNDLIGRSFF